MMMLPDMMSPEEEVAFCEDLVLQMAAGDEYLADFFHKTAGAVLATELGWPLKPSQALPLAEVESKVRPYLAEVGLLPLYLAVIQKGVDHGKRRSTGL